MEIGSLCVFLIVGLDLRVSLIGWSVGNWKTGVADRITFDTLRSLVMGNEFTKCMIAGTLVTYLWSTCAFDFIYHMLLLAFHGW